MAITRDIARNAEAEAVRAAQTAEEAATQLAAAKAVAAGKQREAEEQRRAWEREETSWRLRAGDEARKLTRTVDAVLAQRVTGRPKVESRGIARGLLYGLEGVTSASLLERLAVLDERLGQLLGAQRQVTQAQFRTGELADEALNLSLDELEVRAWAAVARRIRVCAGEVE